MKTTTTVPAEYHVPVNFNGIRNALDEASRRGKPWQVFCLGASMMGTKWQPIIAVQKDNKGAIWVQQDGGLSGWFIPEGCKVAERKDSAR